MKEKHIKTAKIFKAFCDENRLEILELLQSGEKCACELLEWLNISQPTLSHHMKILVDSGIVTARKQGKWVYYAFNAVEVKVIQQLLSRILTMKKECCCE